MLKEIYVVLSYCDTEEKIKYLKNTLKYLNEKNIDILLSSKYHDICDVANDVNYVVISENKSTDKIIRYKRDYYGGISVKNVTTDHGVNVIEQIYLSYKFVKSLNKYDKIVYVNYDIDTDKLSKIDFNYSGDYRFFRFGENFVSAVIFSLKINNKVDNFIESLMEFNKGKAIIEEFLKIKLDKNNLDGDILTNNISTGLYSVNKLSFIDGENIHIGFCSDKLSILVINSPVTLKIMIGETTLFDSDIKNGVFTYPHINKDLYKKLIEKDILKIVINNNIVSHDILSFNVNTTIML
jgi:hypothetical protein